MNPFARHRLPLSAAALGWAAGLAVPLALVAILAADGFGAPARAQTSAAPVASCTGSMEFDHRSGQCRSPLTEACRPRWPAVQQQCERTVLGSPASALTQHCPAATVPRYGGSVGVAAPTEVSCLTLPSTQIDDGSDPEQNGGGESSSDGVARPLHHLAGESDERLAELGIHRCSNGLLSYVPCDELPGREWDYDESVCDDIDGTVFRTDHGGTCVTGSDLLTKCTAVDDCEQTTIRTYCPAIRKLVYTEIQVHVHPDRGAESYRVCVFDCDDFGALPLYVRFRINGSYDYDCKPDPVPVEKIEHDEEIENDEDCRDLPTVSSVLASDGEVEWVSFVRSAARSSGQQGRMPGGGRYLQVAPGRGWIELSGTLDVYSGECTWIATALRATWSELRPWVASERRQIAAGGGMGHLLDQWDALSADQQQLVRRWHTPSAVPRTVECTVSTAAHSGESACRWLLRRPAAFAWRSQVCFELIVPPSEDPEDETTEDSLDDDQQDPEACWLTIAQGASWIRSVDDYADGRLTVTAGGDQR